MPPSEEIMLLSEANTVSSPSEFPSVMKWSVQVLAATPSATMLSTSAPTTVTYTTVPEVVTNLAGPNFVPWPPSTHHDHKGTRWGPYFEEGAEPQNVTARVGSTVRLDCKIGLLRDKTVSVDPCHGSKSNTACHKESNSSDSFESEYILTFPYFEVLSRKVLIPWVSIFLWNLIVVQVVNKHSIFYASISSVS